MPNTKSAIRRVRRVKKQTQINRIRRSKYNFCSPKHRTRPYTLQMTVVVLVSHGFLGSNLTSFLNEDFEVVGLNRENLDLNDEQEIKKVLMGINPNYVLLAAGKVGGIGANLNNNFLFFDSNLAIQRNVFNECLDLDIKNIIFFASNTIYPNNIEAPFRENDLDLNNIDSSNYGYSLSKIVGIKAAEILIKKGFAVLPYKITNLNSINTD